MSSKQDKDKSKQLQDKCMSVLNALLRDEDNKYCVDCDSKGPRWASWNLGVFLCIRCAGIHRNLGVHISKVKSVNLDAWTPEQVVSLQQMGNSRARAVYEARLPDNFRRPQNDSSLETFIRAKYEHKKYIAREWVPPVLPEINWEQEIDDEIERQKRKKKSTMIVEKKSLSNVEVPQLPKPKNISPKPGRQNSSSSSAKQTAKVDNKTNADLLGLQQQQQQQNGGDDSFSNFFSAPVPNSNTSSVENAAEKKDAVSKDVKSEEESFFSQTAPTEKEKIKMTKDSIMALYGAAPTPSINSFNQPPPPVNQMGYNKMGGALFGAVNSSQLQQQAAIVGMPQVYQQQTPSFLVANNGQMQYSTATSIFTPQQQQQYQFPNQQFQMAPTQQPQTQQQQHQLSNQYAFQNQFANQQSATTMMPSNSNQFAVLNQFQQLQQQQGNSTTSSSTNSTTAFAPFQQLPSAAPTYYNQHFQQQFGNLNLGDAANTNTTTPSQQPTLAATNLWQ